MSTMSTTPNTTTNPNMTSEEIEEYLDHLRDRDLPQYIPALLFLILLAVTGLVGNSLVLLVYRTKYPKSATMIFIMSIAILDLMTNVVCIPGHMFEIFHMWDFAWPNLCRLIRYANAITTIPSACILVAVAVTRYRKICKPFAKQVTAKQAKLVTVGIGVFGWTVSIPFFVLNGTHTRPTPIPGIMGNHCFIDDKYINTIWPLLNYAFILFLFFTFSIIMVVPYTFIGIKAYQHRKNRGLVASPVKEKTNDDNNNISGLTEGKLRNRFFGFWNRKNRSKDKHSEAEEVSENGKRSLSEESSVIREMSQTYNTESVHLSDPELDSIKLEGEVFDGEGTTSGSIVIIDNNSDKNHETKDGVGKKSYDGDNAGEMDGKGHGTCPDPERMNPDTTLNTDVKGLEKNNRTALMDTFTIEPTPKYDEQNEKEMHVCETEFHNSDETEMTGTQCRFGKTGSSPISVLETNANKTSDHRVKTENNTDESPQPSPRKMEDVSSETTEEIKKTKIVLNVHGKNNDQKNVFNKTTGMLFLITAVFILGFIPHIAIVFFRYTQPTTFKAMGISSLTAHHLFFRSYLLNSAANPIVYSLCDARFRQNVLCLFKKLKCCRSFK